MSSFFRCQELKQRGLTLVAPFRRVGRCNRRALIGLPSFSKKGSILTQQGSPANSTCVWDSIIAYGCTGWLRPILFNLRRCAPPPRANANCQIASVCATSGTKRKRQPAELPRAAARCAECTIAGADVAPTRVGSQLRQRGPSEGTRLSIGARPTIPTVLLEAGASV